MKRASNYGVTPEKLLKRKAMKKKMLYFLVVPAIGIMTGVIVPFLLNSL